MSKKAISAALVRQECNIQCPVYYCSKAFQGAEERYTPLEKLALTLVTSAKELRSYFQDHPIKVPTSYPLRQVLQNPELFGCLAKWSIELSEFDIKYVPRPVIKAQVLADFIVKFIDILGIETRSIEKTTMTGPEAPTSSSCGEELEIWKLFVDGSRGATEQDLCYLCLTGIRRAMY